MNYYSLVNMVDKDIKVGPRKWNANIFTQFLKDENITFEFPRFDPYDNIVINDTYTLIRTIIGSLPSLNPFYQQHSGPTYIISDDVVVGNYGIANIPIDQIQFKIKKEITNNRFNKEIGGIEIGGNKIATDRSSQSLIIGVRMKSDSEPSRIFNWKSGITWIELNHDAILSISNAVFDHVEDCFDKEKELHDIVDNLDTSEVNYDDNIELLQNLNIDF